MEIIKDLNMDEMTLYHHILNRNVLTTHDQKQLMKSIQGRYGEELFRKLAIEYVNDGLAFFDLKFEVVGKEFQIDACMVLGDELFLFEIKWLNYDVECADGKYFFADSSDEIITINQQTTRTKALFEKFMEVHGLKYTVHYYHVFINKEYKVYGIGKNMRCLHFYDVQRFLHDHSSVPLFTSHHRLKDVFLSQNLARSKYASSVTFDFECVTKGVMCHCGRHFMVKQSQRNYNCACNRTMATDELLKKSLYDYKLCFPDEKVTVSRMYEWMDKLVSKRTVIRFLNKHYEKTGVGRSSHYI